MSMGVWGESPGFGAKDDNGFNLKSSGRSISYQLNTQIFAHQAGCARKIALRGAAISHRAQSAAASRSPGDARRR
jgi:hypothetical protein